MMKLQAPLRSGWPVLALLLASTPLYADEGGGPVAIHPGDPAVDGGSIRPYTNKWKITQVTPDGIKQELGTWSDEVELSEMSGRAILKRTQVETLPKRTVTTVNIVDRRTLAPVYSEVSDTRGYYRRWEFDGNKVRVKRSAEPPAPGGEVRQSEKALDMPVYDFLGGMYGLLLSAFPLNEGYAAKFPIFDDELDGLSWITFAVKGKEQVDAGPGRRVESWAIETEAEHFKMTFYLSKEVPYVIRLIQVGPKGGRLIFDMI